MAIKEDIIKSFGDNVVLTGNSIVDKKVLTIPVSPALDIILNGGIPEGSFVILTGQPKSGKAQRLTDIVYTPYGPKTIGSIKVGDKVSNHNGTVSSVVGVYPQGKKDIYQVKFNDGSYTYCGLDHNWTVAKNNGYENYTTLTLEQILNEGLRQKDRYKWRIPTAKPVFFKQKKRLNLKPYILGSILDSGSINGGDLILTTNNKSILNTFKNFYDHHYKELKIKRIDRYDYIVKEKQSSGLLTYNNLLQSLRALRLTHNGQIVPFIPSSYKYSSLKNRQQLIRGIFDSGAINNSGRIARYNSTNERLILDIREVLESLGYFCKIYKENIETTINYETKQYLVFKLTVQGKDINELFSISSKKNPIKHKAEIFRTITDINKVGHEDAVCIEVDNSDGLYLTNNFIVTHNTTTSLDFAATAQKTEYAHGSFKDGRQVYYLNIEGRLKKRDLEGIPGLDLNRFHVIGSQQGKILHAEEYLQIAEKIINEVPGSVLIIDSYSALCTEAEITSDMDKMQRADGAKLLAKFCRKVANVIPVNQNVVIGITHLMGNPTGYGAEFKEKSGQAIAYQTDVKLRVKSFKPWTLSADNTQIGQEVEWQVICSALGPPGGVITSYIRYGSGVDKHMEAISLASDLGLIQKGGAWYTLISSKDKPKFQGTEKVRAYLLENPKEYDELVNNIKQTMGIKCS